MGCKKTVYLFRDRRKFFTKEDLSTIYERVFQIIRENHFLQSPETFTTIVSELIQNAMKANAKKYILDQGDSFKYSDFFLKSSYEGEVFYRFRDDFDYTRILADSPHWIQVLIYIEDSFIHANIINSSPLSSNEEYRIHRVEDLANQNWNFLQLYKFLSPRAESGGIGLAMSYYLLRSENLSSDLIQIKSIGDITYVSFKYPSPNFGGGVGGYNIYYSLY